MAAPLLIAALLGVVAAAPPRVALYTGAGASAGSAGNFSAAFAKLAAAGTIASITHLDGAGVALLSRANFDVVVFPGGGGSSEAAGIGSAGATAVKSFVSGGGGYYGTCAGGFLSLSYTCCSEVIPGFCGGKVGSYVQFRTIRRV